VWTVVTPATLVRGVGAEARIAKFLAPHGPMHEKPERRIRRPIPG
jgi:hypothetical protein